MQARIAVQCTCPDTGLTGSFAFTGESHRIKNTRVSPVCTCLTKLFPWLKANGWTEKPGGLCERGKIPEALALKITGDDREIVFDPNGLCEQALLPAGQRVPLGRPGQKPSELSGEPSYEYRSNQVTLRLTEDEIYRMARLNLGAPEALALIRNHGVFHEVHDDFFLTRGKRRTKQEA